MINISRCIHEIALNCTLMVAWISFLSMPANALDDRPLFDGLQLPVGDRPSDVQMGDFNNDGNLDLISGSFGSGISLYLGLGNGKFEQEKVIDPPFNFPRFIVLGDYDNDGNLDFIVDYAGGTAYSVALGNGNGTFQPFLCFNTKSFPQGSSASHYFSATDVTQRQM